MNNQNSNDIELCLFAPHNDEVKLTSSWNDWKAQPMAKRDDGWWQIKFKVPDGQHFYKFAVKSKSYFAMDQWVEVFDPYAASITDDEHENSILQIKDGKRIWTDYTWRHDDRPLPTNDQLVIYELHVGDFSGGAGIAVISG